MKYTQKDSRLRCPKCYAFGGVWGGFWGKEVHYKCKRCNGSWEVDEQKILPIAIYNRNMPNLGRIATQAYCIFYGFWTKNELDLVEQVIVENTDNNYKSRDWSLFKGRHVITAWRFDTPIMENIIIKDTMKELLIEIENWCLAGK